MYTTRSLQCACLFKASRTIPLLPTISWFPTKRSLTTFSIIQSGHNKWSKIKHTKSKNDLATNRLNSKHSGLISTSIRLGNSFEPNSNSLLSAAIAKAMKENVPKHVIENAINKAKQSTGTSGTNCQYEARGPGGAAIVVEAVTDNKNRTVGLVRSTITKAGGSMGDSEFMFENLGIINVEAPEGKSEEEFLETIFEIDNVIDVKNNESSDNSNDYVIVSESKDCNEVVGNLKNIEGLDVKDVSIIKSPKKGCELELGPEAKEKLDKLIDTLLEIDDVTNVHTNVK